MHTIHTQHLDHSPHIPHTCQIHQQNAYTHGHLQCHSWDNLQLKLSMLTHCSFLFCKNTSVAVSPVSGSLVWNAGLQGITSGTEGSYSSWKEALLFRVFGSPGLFKTWNPTADSTWPHLRILRKPSRTASVLVPITLAAIECRQPNQLAIYSAKYN